MTPYQRRKALKTLRHILLYLNGHSGADRVRLAYLQIRGPYDFRKTGHVDGKCCDRYREKRPA